MNLIKYATPFLGLMSVSAFSEDFLPIVEIPLYITSQNITCELFTGDEYDRESNKTRDWCDADASIDVRVNMSLMRSIRSSTKQGGFTPDAKFARFTVDNKGHGAGIHLVDDLKQEYVNFRTWTDRNEVFGPLATSYNVWVKPSSGYMPKIVKNYPDNKNRNFQHRETSGFTIGVDAKKSLEFSKDGPKGGVDFGASFGYQQSKTLVFDTQEYEIVNRSSLHDFSLSFKRTFGICDAITRKEASTGCYFSGPIWSNAWVFDKHKVNPIAYANFKPNYDVIYEAPVNEQGQTHFEIGAGVDYSIYTGRVQYGVIAAFHITHEEIQGSHNISSTFIVDWSHPIFLPEKHVILQSLAHANQCLTADETSNNVFGSECDNELTQVWGYDKEQRYVNRQNPQTCLSINNDKQVIKEPCSSSLAQKWQWKNNQLISFLPDGENVWALDPDALGQVINISDGEHAKRGWLEQQINLHL
ncbi:leukocidin family pore-forming toxin [Vibrio parahaemolyticus]|uniref:leukocidin family pore-forming toxin n=1 Tax=Vibrio parahaemolyticus TaxID=670 RepID=UPI00226AEC8C|nr:leukocidin family pore-forming toxin [Vibrio parahaemolyticus]MCX8902984.1 leukocidin family pore-forming toxin [Vibrio parahaemolyticus]